MPFAFKFFRSGYREFSGEQVNQALRWACWSPIILACSDEVTPITAGLNVIKFRVPRLVLDATPRISVGAVSTNGAVQVNVFANGVSILGSALTIPQGSLSSFRISGSLVRPEVEVADDALISVDIISAGANVTGLKLMLIGRRYAP